MISDQKRVLVVEDEAKITNVIRSFLESKGFSVLCAEDGSKAIDIFNHEPVSIVLLDLMLPKISGEEVCKIMRSKSKVPIIMLTAKSKEADMLKGLGLGADDYITKPFSLKTLNARIEAVLRRSAEDIVVISGRYLSKDGDLTVDFDNRIVIRGKEEVKLTPNEFKLLVTLIRNPKKAFTRDELIAGAFENDFDGFDRTIDSHIKNLRQKIEKDVKNPIYILTVHGVGYKFGGD